jgi:rhamnose transport system permease protein
MRSGQWQKRLPSQRIVLLLVLGCLFLVFSTFIEGFFDLLNLVERSRYWVATGMIAVPMTFIIAAGGIDLSVGSILALSGIVLGLLYRDAAWPIGWAALAAVGTGGLAGGLNGWVSSYLRVPSLVVTLATMALFSGAAMGLSRARPVGNLPLSFQWLGQGDLFQIPLGRTGLLSIPVPLLVLALTVSIGGLLLRRSWVGRFTECIGENETAAQFAAIDVRRIKLALFTASGLVCGLASLLYTALYATARPDAGRGLELESIACVVLGGTRIRGGKATVTGTLAGLLLIGILRYGLEMAGVKSEQLVVVVGCLLVVAAVFSERFSARGET